MILTEKSYHSLTFLYKATKKDQISIPGASSTKSGSVISCYTLDIQYYLQSMLLNK